MKNKMTTEEFKQYIIAEAKKLYQAEIIKESVEKNLSLLKEDATSMGFELDPETLKKVRQEMIRKAAGWDFSQPQQLDEKKGKAVNPWAICHASTGPEKDAKFERCVMDVKAKNKIKKESETPESKEDK